MRPHRGSILCFPHGDAMGSLAHEGTSVTQGVKYVIRTDVLYMLPKKETRADAPSAILSSHVADGGSRR